MFSVPRYNPASKKQGINSTGKKRKRPEGSNHREDVPNKRGLGGLKVIARDPDGPTTESKERTDRARSDEAIDDFDLLLEETQGELSHEHHASEPHHSLSADHPEIRAALHATTLPMDQVARAWELAPFLCENLKRDGFESFFPIQAMVIPEVITLERHPYLRAQDVCITAPTGSGKSLAYVLPILNALAHRTVRHLRALVVLPGRDLARQVFSVFEDYIQGSELKVGLAIGQSDFKAEQKMLSIDPDASPHLVASQSLAFDPGNLHLTRLASRDGIASGYGHVTDRGAIDILVCTPGRLVDHLDNTPGFTLQHLKFLVVDEADRLLSQTYQNWIDRVVEDANSASVRAWRDMEANGNNVPKLKLDSSGLSYQIDPITWRRGGSAGDTSQFNTNVSSLNAAASVCRPVQLRKFLVSATLSRDPQKLSALKLVNPKHFDVHKLNRGSGASTNKFAMATGLSEYWLECKAEQKPILLLALLLQLLENKGEKWTVVVFTASVDSTHRLARLLQLLWIRGNYGSPDAVTEFSSALNQSERTALLSRCCDPNDTVSVLVCSDGMSRGMDLEKVHAVINYDVPTLAKTYVHRCGRTARAGKSGTAISILKGGQVPQFRRMRDLIQSPESVQTWNVKKSLVKDALPIYRECLQVLRNILQDEENGDMAPTHPLEPSLFEENDTDIDDDSEMTSV